MTQIKKAMSTLRDMRQDGYGFWASCAIDFTCTHAADLNLDHLIQRLGWHFRYIEERQVLIGMLRCSKCGRRGAQIQLRRDASPGHAGRAHTESSVDYATALQRALEFNAAHPRQHIRPGKPKPRRH